EHKAVSQTTRCNRFSRILQGEFSFLPRLVLLASKRECSTLSVQSLPANSMRWRSTRWVTYGSVGTRTFFICVAGGSSNTFHCRHYIGRFRRRRSYPILPNMGFGLGFSSSTV